MQSINTLLDPVVNFGKVTVSTGYTNLDTVIVLTAGHGSKLPNPSLDNPFNLVWYDSSSYGDPSDDPNVEIVRCTDNNTDVLTVIRAQEGTLASNKNTPTKTYRMILTPTKKTISDIKTEYESGISSGISYHSALDTGIHGVGISTVDSVSARNSAIGTHATITSNIHNFDASGNAPAQVHGVSKHTGTIGDHANLTSIGTNSHSQIDTAISNSTSHIAANGTSVHGLGTMSTQNANNVGITGGNVSGLSSLGVSGNIAVTGTVDNVDISAHVANVTTVHLPSQGGNSGKYLKTDGSIASWQTWQGEVGSLSAQIPKMASANVRNSNDAQVSQQSTSYILMKTITLINGLAGTIRVYFEVDRQCSSYTGYIRIAHNGVSIVDYPIPGSCGYNSYSYDITDTFLPGDTIQLWGAQPSSIVYAMLLRNFRLAYDNDPTVASMSSNP